MNTTILQLVDIYNIQLHVSALYVGHHQNVQRILRCVIPVVCRKTNGEVNISHENTTMVFWIYDVV